ERDLARFAEVLGAAAGFGVAEVPGSGAAGGLGAALAALGAELVSGSEVVAREIRLAERVAAADLVLGGEGRVDAQTFEGKSLARLAAAARASRKPLVVLCGARDPDLVRLHRHGITAVVPIAPGPIS